MVWPLRPQPDAGTVGKPKPPAFGLFGRHLQPFAPPDALHAFIVDDPAGIAQQSCDLPVTVAAIPSRQFDQIGRQPLFVVTAPRRLALC